MARILQVAQLGHPVLRTKASAVCISDLQQQDTQDLIADLFATLKDADGVGIAAPQVYNPLRIMIIASRPNSRYPDAPEMDPVAVINPEDIVLSKETVTGWEGCLSIPGIRGRVLRSEGVSFTYTDAQGKKSSMSLSGFPARIFQHEYDHLEGILFPDRMESMKDLVTEKEYFRILAEESSHE
ncbi:MAG: Peptide deformylase [candidate division WS6 bacterium OLB20]|uniref:Peptide deformylase n=1 Tax=candidate division WS6 bacterium OLB20 TaxID=1617426 RepID=A0A136M049_9BACT|nr:MAG: Peptide deformylase [candidate division WS6 bacterium OLB20]